MLSSLTTKASTEVNEHQINGCIIVFQAGHILQEAVFVITEEFSLCVYVLDFPTNRKDHQAGIAPRT